MVKIRLKRMGAKKTPFYRIVVADSRTPRDGRFIEEIGTYDPLKDPVDVKIDEAKAKEWLDRGAKPTEVVKSLFKKLGIGAKVYVIPDDELEGGEDAEEETAEELEEPVAAEEAVEETEEVAEETEETEEVAEETEEAEEAAEETEEALVEAEEPAEESEEVEDK